MSAAATTTDSTATNSEGPVLNLINKRLRSLRKKHNRILQMEESLSQGKPLNKEQEEVFRSKPAVTAQIDELEKLRQPLSTAVAEEISLALQLHQTEPTSESRQASDEPEPEPEPEPDRVVEELLNLLYFGLLFDVKSRDDFTSTMLTRIHERGCCLTYDYVTDDDEEANDLLSEKDLDSISMLSGLLTSRPAHTSLSHKNALCRCIHHAKLWLSNSEQPIDPDAGVSYAGLRERLNKIMALDYFTTTPEMKDPAEVAAAAGAYSSFQVPVTFQVEESAGQYEEKEEDASNYQESETGDNQFSTADELQQDNLEKESHAEDMTIQQEHGKLQADNEEVNEQQYVPRRPHQNQRGGRGNGGGRRGNFNGRGGRGSGRRGLTYQQNGHNRYHDQPGNYYPRNQYNNRGRGGRGGGQGHENHGSAVQGGDPSADVGVAS